MKLYYWTEGEGENKVHFIVEPSRFVLLYEKQGLNHVIDIDYIAEKRLFLYENLNKLDELGITSLNITRDDSDLIKAIRFFEVATNHTKPCIISQNFGVIANFINSHLKR